MQILQVSIFDVAPPDGQNPTMNMFLWNTITPNRDGSLDNSIPVHEYGHGISNRMTGGRGQANCLGQTESRGMGEGWSDVFAIYLERTPGENRTQLATVGSYATTRPNGIRQYPYSTNTTTNPLLYSNVNGLTSVHAIGTIWATILYEMYWNLVDAWGFSANYMDSKQEKGNIMAMQVVIGGLALQPCNPTFITARNAILAADVSYYGGKNKCSIWKAFAKRGLGTDAVQSGYQNGFAVPTDCNETQPTPTSTVTPTSTIVTSTTVRPTTTSVVTTTVARTTSTVVPTTTRTTATPSPTAVPCAHDKCVRGVALNAACDPCVARIIRADSYCGRVMWDSTCVRRVRTVCGLTCQ
jgi:extracellular elastinolytic metalloproteinase